MIETSGDVFDKDKSITQRWIGLGTSAAYRPALNEGLMVFHDGRTPPVRCMGWLVLTEKGAALLEEHGSMFQEILDKLNKIPEYRHSYVANFQLTGGLSK